MCGLRRRPSMLCSQGVPSPSGGAPCPAGIRCLPRPYGRPPRRPCAAQQGNVGDVNTPRPGMLDFKGGWEGGRGAGVQRCSGASGRTSCSAPLRCMNASFGPPHRRRSMGPQTTCLPAFPPGKAKWDAWKKQEGKSKEAAMQVRACRRRLRCRGWPSPLPACKDGDLSALPCLPTEGAA